LEPGFEWRIRLSGGKVILDGLGGASVHEAHERPVYIGRTDDIIRQVAALTGANQAETDAALAAVAGPVDFDAQESARTKLAIYVAIAALLFGGGFVAGRSLRR
jgi:hypothetical protein